mgnify:CR=1 FL=1
MLALDLFQMGALLFITGGLNNPFAPLICIPVIISFASQPSRHSIALFITALAFITVLAFTPYPLPWFEGRTLEVHPLLQLGMWSSIVSMTAEPFIVTRPTGERVRVEPGRAPQLVDDLVLVERTHELARANRELEAFAYSVSHDLRTPLRSINGYAALLTEEFADALPADARSHLERIRSSATRMGQLITDLLTLARLSQAELNRQPVDLSLMARQIAGELALTGSGRCVHWQIEDGMQVDADPVLMRVVMLNLLGNAWKYTGQRAEAHIDVSHRVDADGTVRCCVRDDGAGFDMKYASQLFEPFKRLHAHHEFEGTGVGLATVHRVIERHGGRVWGEGAWGRAPP